MVYSGSYQDTNAQSKTKRADRKGGDIDSILSQFEENVGECLPNEGLLSHWYSHADTPLINYEVFLHINQLMGEECGKICKSQFGLISHLIVN